MEIRIKYKLNFLGLKKVNWEKYDFHLTPVVTYSYLKHPSGDAECDTFSIEWGHWAICLLIAKIYTNN